MPADAFLGDGEKVGNSKYQLIVAIEGSIDLANHNWDVDDEAVHAYLQDDIGDIRTFLEHLLGHFKDA